MDLSDNELLDLLLGAQAAGRNRLDANARCAVCWRDCAPPRPTSPRRNKTMALNPSNVKATLSFSDGSPTLELPIYKGIIGPDVIDIRKLYAQTGKFTYDPGFLSTASCNSTITYIDGDKGELLYRGYPIEQLATKCDYLETCYLLLYGELPEPDSRRRTSPSS